jgi:hypothetical protein
MTQIEKIQLNVSKLLIKSIFIKNYKGSISNDDEKLLGEVRSILGEDTFVKLCCKIMEETEK